MGGCLVGGYFLVVVVWWWGVSRVRFGLGTCFA